MKKSIAIIVFGLACTGFAQQRDQNDPYMPKVVPSLSVSVQTESTKWTISCSGMTPRGPHAPRGIEYSTDTMEGNADVKLLLARRFLFRTEDGKGQYQFSVNDKGLLSLNVEGPFAEVLQLNHRNGTTVATLKLPDGDRKMAERLARKEKETEIYKDVLNASAQEELIKEFNIKELMRLYSFPEDQISYPIERPSDVQNVTLLAFVEADESVQRIPFQFSKNNEGKDILCFRTDLPSGASRMFRLVRGDYSRVTKQDAALTQTLSITSSSIASSQEIILTNGLVQARLPNGYGSLDGKPLVQVPAPILQLHLDGVGRALAKASFEAPNTIVAESYEAKIVEEGPLFTRYEIQYTLKEGKKYAVTLELRANEKTLRIGETLKGFSPDDKTFLRVDYGKGLLDPDGSLVASNGGYFRYSDAYTANDKRDGKEWSLNSQLGLYTPNSLGLMRAITFYQDEGDAALLVTLDRIEEWKTPRRSVWSSTGQPENIFFFGQGDAKYLRTALAGTQRFWTLSVIPRVEVNMVSGSAIPCPDIGPEVVLLNRLTDWNLDRYKDRLADWPETLDAAPFDDPQFNSHGPGMVVAYEEYQPVNVHSGNSFFRWVKLVSWDFSSEVGPVSFRQCPRWFKDYACSRASWTQEQRDHIRQILLWFADSCDADANVPHHSMMGGHPNFIMDVKAVLPLASAAFPTHPKAKQWRDSFMSYFDEWMNVYCRRDVPELNTKGGRWTENISCYTGQTFVGLLDSEKALVAYDGTTLASNPQLLDLIRWMQCASMSPHKGVRMIPPQGAHSRAFEPWDGHSFWKAFYMMCEAIASTDPVLAKEMKWMETNGKEGQKPDLKSTLFTDYGAVFHYDVGGKNESYAHMQNIWGRNYRWGNAGIIYYGARDRAWSYNTGESNGDEFNWAYLSAFTVNNQGLDRGPTDQLLYDFDFVQFYRQPARSPSSPYVARSVMLVRDDYLVLSDEVATTETPGVFRWSNVFELPEIFQLKPGVAAVDSEFTETIRPPRQPYTAKIKSYSGKGDFLTVVAPPGGVAKAEAANFGGIVNGEYVFASQRLMENEHFSGTYGYARKNQVAVFQGTRVKFGDLGLTRDGGDFGASASLEDGRIVGRVVGRSGGKLTVTVPPDFIKGDSVLVLFDGKPVTTNVDGNNVTFSFDIAQRDGCKDYEVTSR